MSGTPELVFNGAFFCHKLTGGSKPVPAYTPEAIHSAIPMSAVPNGRHGVLLVALVVATKGQPLARIQIEEDVPGGEPNAFYDDSFQFSFPGESHVFITKMAISTEREITIWHNISLNGQRVASIPFFVFDDRVPTIA